MHNLRIHETVAGIAAGYRKPITETVTESKMSEKDLERQEKAIKAKANKAKDKKKVTEEDEKKDPKVDAKDADGGHEEASEIQDDPTREKLETPKDEADEKKGGPAELAADIRVSIRIEKMGIGRYRRMLTKHELSADDEKWLKQRIADLEGCIKAMEDKLPALEKEAEGGTAEKKEAVKEGMKADIRRAILELATGK